MSLSTESERTAAPVPEPVFEITGARHLAYAATPTMIFSATAVRSDRA